MTVLYVTHCVGVYVGKLALPGGQKGRVWGGEGRGGGVEEEGRD